MPKKFSFAAGIALCALTVILTVFYAASSASAEQIAPCDITDSFAREEILTVVNAGWMQTYSVDDSAYFEPTRPVTRAELASALVAFLEINPDKYRNTEIGFADEATTNAAALPAIRAALANGLMMLSSEYRFDAETTIPREEAAFLFGALCRAEISAGKDEGFEDFREIDTFFLSNAKKAVDFEIMIGYTDGMFHPKNALTREELALVLTRLSQSQNFRKE